jgi:hypothetical protein
MSNNNYKTFIFLPEVQKCSAKIKDLDTKSKLADESITTDAKLKDRNALLQTGSLQALSHAYQNARTEEKLSPSSYIKE